MTKTLIGKNSEGSFEWIRDHDFCDNPDFAEEYVKGLEFDGDGNLWFNGTEEEYYAACDEASEEFEGNGEKSSHCCTNKEGIL